MTLLWLFRCLIECRDEYKYNVEAVELLIRNHLVNMQQYDLHLAQVHGTHLHYLDHDVLKIAGDEISALSDGHAC